MECDYAQSPCSLEEITDNLIKQIQIVPREIGLCSCCHNEKKIRHRIERADGKKFPVCNLCKRCVDSCLNYIDSLVDEFKEQDLA